MLLLLLLSLASANFLETYYYANDDCSGALVSIDGSATSCISGSLGSCSKSVKQMCVVTPSTTPANMTMVIRAHDDTTCSTNLQVYKSSVPGCVRRGFTASDRFSCNNGVQTWTQYTSLGCLGTGIDIVSNVGCNQCSTTPGFCFVACGTTPSVTTTRTTTTSTSTTNPATASRLSIFTLIFIASLVL